MKLQLWEFQIKSEIFFIFLSSAHINQLIAHVMGILYLISYVEQFACRFADINKHRKKFSYFANAFDVDIYDAQKSYKWNFKVRVSSNPNFRMPIY